MSQKGQPSNGLAISQADALKFALDPNRRRRVPDDLRQRVETSCDRCKTRKRRCIRHSDQEICQACSEAGEECKSTLPRKRRNLAAQSTARYALLDSIIRKLYPDAEVDSLSGLRSLANTLEVDDGRSIGDGDGAKWDNEEMPEGQLIDAASLPPPEGWLVPAPKGGHHYVGSASLIYFARCARELVGKCNLFKAPAFDENGLRRYLQAAEFTTYKSSHTIEANLQGHPATLAADERSPAVDTAIGVSPRGDAPRNPPYFNRGLADRLVNVYFDRIHLNLPIVHRGTFLVQYQRTFSDISLTKEPGWFCTMFMVYTLGAQALEDEHPNAQDIQQHYLSVVIREGLGRLVLTSTLANVQALLLLALYEHNAGERNTAWILVGQAIRAGVALGIHRDGENSDFNPFERNIRRMVWWQLHIFDQYISLALGRPSFSDMVSVDATLPDFGFELDVGLPQLYLENQVALTRLVVKIKQVVAATAILHNDPQRLVEWYPTVMTLHGELIAWKKSQPPSLAMHQVFANPWQRRMVTILQVWADYLESILCRSYLLCRVGSDLASVRPSQEVRHVAALAVGAAHASATKLLILADHGLLEGSVWLDFYAVQSAIMITALQFLGQPHDDDFATLRDSITRLITLSRGMRLAPTYRITMNVALQLACIAGINSEMPMTVKGASPDVPGGSTSLAFAPPAPVQANPTAQIEQLFGPLPPSRRNSQPDMFADLYNFGYDANAPNTWDFFDLGGLGLPQPDLMSQDFNFDPTFAQLPGQHVVDARALGPQ